MQNRIFSAMTAFCRSAYLLVCFVSCQQHPAPTARDGSAQEMSVAQAAPHNFGKWEKAIAAFEQQDRVSPPPQGAVLFIGSSTIARWKTLAEDFPTHQVINRGFGGSEIADATHFASRIIFPYEPRMVLLRSGGNDINNGKTPEQVFADFKQFVAVVHSRLPPGANRLHLAVPSVARWKQAEKEKALNTMASEYASQTPAVGYIESYSLTLGPDGRPRPELFVADKLHLNVEGYRLLADRVRPYLPK